MELLKIFFRDKQQQSVEIFECWEVRWQSRHGAFSHDTVPEIRVFPKRKDAEDFKAALEDAFKLIKHTSGNRVTVTKQVV